MRPPKYAEDFDVHPQHTERYLDYVMGLPREMPWEREQEEEMYHQLMSAWDVDDV